MPTRQGDVALMNDPVAQRLLNSAIPARLAYNWLDGTPRVVPIWFHWNGEELVLGSPPKAPKALRKNPTVSLTIDEAVWPSPARHGDGADSEGVVPEYAQSAKRYFGEEQGDPVGSSDRSDDLRDGAHRHPAGMGGDPGF